MDRKISLVTGANSGIGYATTEQLAKHGHQVIMVCRNAEKAERAKATIQEKIADADLKVYLADFCSLAQVNMLCSQIQNDFPHLDVLINNAAIVMSKYLETEDGFETQFQVNHLSPFLLTNQLLSLLKKSEQSRIINISSNSHYGGKLDFEDLMLKKRYFGYSMYQRTKLCNVLFTYELARRLSSTSVITANAVHPGLIDTSIGSRHSKGLINIAWRIMRLFRNYKTIYDGAKTPVYLATNEALSSVTGKYFANCKTHRSDELTYDEELARRLWGKSEELVAGRV